MTWAEFTAAVNTLLTVDADRVNASDFIANKIKLALLDLQSFIPGYTEGHESTWDEDDFTTVGEASQANMPEGAILTECYIIRTNADDSTEEYEHPCLVHDWEKRYEMINGEMKILDNNGRVAINPQATKLMVYPAILDGVEDEEEEKTYNYSFFICYNGKKVDYDDADTVPFDLETAEAVANYVKAEMARHFEKDQQAYASFLNDYQKKRQQLFLDMQRRTKLD